MLSREKEHKDTDHKYANDPYRDHKREWAKEDKAYDKMSSPATHGYAYSSMPRNDMKLTKEMAEEWTSHMVNVDGTTGPHWSMDQVKQVMAQRGIECDPVEFYAVLNSMYSDYCMVAKKHSVNTVDFYADMAKAWLYDEDSVEEKAGAYYGCVVEH